MFCSISGEVPIEPVVSKVNGYVFEKNLILKYISETGKCPVSGIIMSESDLISVQANKLVKPRQLATMSVPGLLATLQSEWDELMLETFTLKQSLDTTRQELAQAFYQHDAACRVIARLMRERDEARSQLSDIIAHGVSTNASSSSSSSSSSSAMDVQVEVASSPLAVSAGLNEAVLAAVNSTFKELSGKRKGRKAADTLTSVESLRTFSTLDSSTPHKSSPAGITSMAIAGSGKRIITGGVDKEALVIDVSNGIGKVIHKLSGHEKKIISVAFHAIDGEDIQYTASTDSTVKIWNAGKVAATLTHHSKPVTAICPHPTGSYAASVSLDGSWAFLDVHRGECLKQIRAIAPGTVLPSLGGKGTDRDIYGICGGEAEERFACSYLCGKFHPDGLIFATGTIAEGIKLWDIREQQNVATFVDHNASINSLSFSENGYLLASAGGDGSVKIWDLRKLKCAKSIEVSSSSPATAVSFDSSGLYLAFAGGEGSKEVQAVVVKDYNNLFADSQISHRKPVTGVCWGPDAGLLLSCSMDRSIKLHGLGESK